MHRLAERRVTYLWLTIALALIAGLAITLNHITIPGGRRERERPRRQDPLRS